MGSSMTREEHLEHLDLYGYTIVEGALEPGQVRTLRTATEALYETDPGVAAKREHVPEMFHVENLVDKGEPFETFWLNDKVLPLVSHFLGEDFIAGDMCSFGVGPKGFTQGATAFGAFHSDDALPVPGKPLSIVNMYVLVDVSAKNGATRVVPGSHRTGRHPDQHAYVGEVTLDAPAGSCLVFFGSVWHASGPNWTDETRTTAVAAFSRSWIKPYIDFTRAVRPEVVERATPEARRILGFQSQSPWVERWQWDEHAGRPKVEQTA